VSLGADNTVTFPLTGSWVPYSAFGVDSGITRAVWNQELATETLTATLIDEAGGITVPLCRSRPNSVLTAPSASIAIWLTWGSPAAARADHSAKRMTPAF
jgi:hypothetical protein